MKPLTYDDLETAKAMITKERYGKKVPVLTWQLMRVMNEHNFGFPAIQYFI